MHKELGEDRTRIADPKWPKGYPIPCSAVKASVKKEEKATLGVTVFVFPSKLHTMSPALCDVSEHLPADG